MTKAKKNTESPAVTKPTIEQFRKTKEWRWPHQLKRPRTGWVSHTLWTLKASWWNALIRDRSGWQAALRLWDWLNPFMGARP